jgi:hypothetical protein
MAPVTVTTLATATMNKSMDGDGYGARYDDGDGHSDNGLRNGTGNGTSNGYSGNGYSGNGYSYGGNDYGNESQQQTTLWT